MTLSEKIARFIAEKNFSDIPQDAKEEAKRIILDWIAALLAALAEAKEEINLMANTLLPYSEGKIKVVGLEKRVSPLSAALFNGYIGHLLDYDELNNITRGHQSTVELPALLAIGEERRISGEKLLESYIIGMEVGTRIGEAFTPDWFDMGWHGSSVFGVFCAAAGCGKILGLNPEQLQMAIGIAASLASGLSQNFGTLTKPLHIGIAAHNGLLAALLASQGFTSDKEALEKGYYKAYAWLKKPRLETLDKMGNPWVFSMVGALYPKLYSCCHGAQPTIDAAILLKEKYQIPPEDIEEIELYANWVTISAMMSRNYADTGEVVARSPQEGPPRLIKPGIPKTPIEGKFSLEYTFARTILDGKIKMSSFTDEKLNEPRVQELMKKTKTYHDPQCDKPGFDWPGRQFPWINLPCRDVIKLKDGRILEEAVYFIKERPWREVEEKFDDCSLEAGFSEERREKIKSMVKDLERVEDISELLELL